MNGPLPIIIRKTKCSRIPKRNVHFPKTKRIKILFLPIAKNSLGNIIFEAVFLSILFGQIEKNDYLCKVLIWTFIFFMHDL